MNDYHPLPSPASSPSPSSTEVQPQQSRKRQRSRSMQSDASSSVKRSVSDGAALDSATRAPQSDQLSTLSLLDANSDIDSYMAEQGEASIPRTISSATLSGSGSDSADAASAKERYDEVERSRKKPLVVGEDWYLVSDVWWGRWRCAVRGLPDKQGIVLEEQIGPVDNVVLVTANNKLKTNLIEEIDYYCVPAEVWSVFIEWYGQPEITLKRKVVPRGNLKYPALEIYPPVFRCLRMSKQDNVSAALPGDQSPFLTIEMSSNDKVKALYQRLAIASSTVKPFTPSIIYRVWRVSAQASDLNYTEMPLSVFRGLEREIVAESEGTVEDAGYQMNDAFVVEFQQSGTWIIGDLATTTDSTPIFSGEGFFDRMQGSSGGALRNEPGIYNRIVRPAAKAAASFFTPNNRQLRPMEPGTLGLGNMGNTCFMNSALQCLAHTKELTDYFLTGVYHDELNPGNPLGMQGAIAEVYGGLLHRIWANSGVSTSYSPREFKMQLQRFAPQFSGYQQHDSQELVAFLLDGLHEDLNRIKKKPYVEKPDWEGGGDSELVKLANTSWKGYMKRNDSVIVDLFQGQYQSTLVCPECSKVSITFDPFMYLTLPLPIRKKWRHKIYYVPWDSNKPHIIVPVELNGDASFRDLRNLLGRWLGTVPENLLTLEIFSHRFFKNLDDNVFCGEVSDSDKVVCFELPCHAQQTNGYKRQINDPLILPMFLLESQGNRPTYGYRQNGAFGYPTVVVIDREMGRNVEAMYEAALARLQRWTKNADQFFTWEEAEPMQTDSPPEGKGEGDIADEKSMFVSDDSIADPARPPGLPPRRKGFKKAIFGLKIQSGHKAYGTTQGFYGAGNRFDSWERRMGEADGGTLIRNGDAFYCEFDEHMKGLFFGDDSTKWDYALWDKWEEFEHPEYQEAKRAQANRQNKGITLQDCLDEFTKEEKLGEDDLWYCPRCKKHQQATKRFDLWKVPDILVVHLKRFSNNRTLRDKIDALVDFPVEGLDLTSMIGERAAAKKLAAAGIDIAELNLTNVDEPLVYDLYGVDEHMGGLGGGHYRAYALNHVNEKWYHFDDSFVTPARAADAVNPNAYLLFYRRRSTTPLGGKLHEKIEEARLTKAEGINLQTDPSSSHQLPTPPNEPASPPGFGRAHTPASRILSSPLGRHHGSDDDSDNGAYSGMIGPHLLDSVHLGLNGDDDFFVSGRRGSPTSSNEAEIDVEDGEDWTKGVTTPEAGSGMASPSSGLSDSVSPFDNANEQYLGDQLSGEKDSY